ncbi:amino acid adenylation domain-containing protein, partial [Methanobrevibacter sp.]|uniref:amino acid adenylation domain-containing protein n=1 Tax=Methanobrevibacter sp. TaxID=66852 RepID=UPI003890A8DA
SRKAVNNFVSWYVGETGFTSDDVYGMHCSYVFDMHAHALYSPVITGGSLYVVPEEIRLDLKALNEYFVEHNCTHTFITSQVGKLFAESGMETTIKLLCFGGMKLGELNAPDSIGPFESYGPSENLAISTSIFANRRIHSSSIGYFISNVRGYVLDKEHRRVPIGAVGELYLSGHQLTKGYLNRDEENINALFDNPFDDEEGYERIYKTGDIVRFLPDGTLGIVGRQDSQVKIRGNRVELPEVESIIRELDCVDDVTVQTINNEGNNELVAYVVISENIDGDLGDHIKDYVNDHKPDYMVPSFVIELDEIPLNVNGKVDKHALPDVDLDTLHAEYVAPTNEIEESIIKAFEDVFNQKIGLNDDFMRLGGDSITTIRVISLLEKESISCDAKDILKYKTPYLIAKHVRKDIDANDYDSTEGIVDLLPIQSYFFDQVNLDNFSQKFVLEVNEKLELHILQKAIDELCNIHDMLRAVYRFDDNNNPVQEILPANTPIYKINEYYIEKNFDKTMQNIFIQSILSINMRDKLLDISLIHYDDKQYLIFVVHHLIIDGVSWNTILMDLTHIYLNLLEGKEVKINKPYPYKLWVDDVKKLVENISEEEKQHWIKINESLDESLIAGPAKNFKFTVDADYDLDNQLMLSEEEYFALAISRAYEKTYGENIIFNYESHGRDESIAKLNRSVGWFTSQYPITVPTNYGRDNISVAKDVYSIKNALKNVNNLGLNYQSLIYTAKELTYKHCPITFNFLGTEFAFKNELFESINQHVINEDGIEGHDYESQTFGITFNVFSIGNSYVIHGDYAINTYLGDKISTFIDNVKNELEFLGKYESEDIVCTLSESQLGVYLDEKVNKKGNAYSVPNIMKCDSDVSIDRIKIAINALIDKHPILKGRVIDTEDMPLLLCDSYPQIEVVNTDKFDVLIKPFDLHKSLVRFFIVENNDGIFIMYDMHHMVSDATSRMIIEEELNQALNDTLNPELDLGFVYNSNDSFESKFKEEYKNAKEFYRNIFADIDEVQSLLSDINGCKGTISLPIRGIRNKIESFTNSCGITVGNLLNAVFAYTYSRFTGSNKVYYNYTEHGRHENYSQNALGMFVRTIPIIVDCRNKTVIDYLNDFSDLILDSMHYSIYPFRLLAREFDLSNTIGFEYNYDLNDVSDVGNDIIFSDDADTVSEFLCVVNDLEDGFVIRVSYLDKYSSDTIVRFLNAFKEILIQILDKEKLGDINYISDSDVELLDSFNETEHPLDYADVLDAFNDNLKKNSDKSLVKYKDISYTYGEGAFIADRINKSLKDMGIDVGDNVAFLVERSELYMFSVLGILSAGAVYVPLDDAHPDERIEFILNDTESKVLIVSDETYDRAKDLLVDVTLLNISDIVNDEIGSLSKLPVIYGDLACILYTSGTTGVPKGIKITRMAIVNYIQNYVNMSGIDSGDVFALYSSIGFDVGAVKSLCVPIYSGACLNIVPNEIRFDVKKLNSYFINNNVTHTNLPTQVSKIFINEVDETSLKVLVCGGEKLGEINTPTDYLLFDAYGPTECCVSISAIKEKDKIDPSSIGFIFDNIKAYILDDELRQVPLGVAGELYVSGNQVGKGYVNREEEDRNAFVANPFIDDENYKLMYRTGDIVRFLPDGTLGIIGRRDNQVKIRGNRVELTEIEELIRRIDYVDDVTVQTIKNMGNYELVAYVVVNNDWDENILSESIQNYVLEHTPDYMVPSYVIKLDEIPLNINGKVDKRALPEIDFDSLRAGYVAPTNKMEKIIAEAFERVFDQKGISLFDDFLRLGGDSLIAIKLLSLLEDYNIGVVDILSLRTPYAIAKNIKENSFDLDIYSVDSGCPLNESQLNVYLDIVTNNKVDSYLIPLSMNISKEYDIDAITDALDKIFEVHPILGMCISDEFDVPYLVNKSKPSITLESDVSDEFIAKFLTNGFDLHDSLCRFLIVETNVEYKLFAVFHHIIFDALSDGVFKKDLQSIIDGEVVDVDESFLKVSAFSQQIGESYEYVEADEFFNSMLADSEETDILLGSVLTDGPGSCLINLDLDYNLLHSFLNKHSISENVLFSGAFAYTLSRFAGSEKVLFNIIENGRDRFNNYNSIGMFVNTLPLLVDCKNRDIHSFMEYVSRMVYGVMRHNYYPFRLLANKYGVDSNVLFQFIPDWIKNPESSDSADVNKLEVSSEMNDFIADFEVNVIQKGKKYSLIINHSDKYASGFVSRFMESYKLILQDMLTVVKLSDINYIVAEDIALLDGYNDTEHSLSHDDILDVFNENLRENPDKYLVKYNDLSYTYREGAFIADRINKSLKDMGVDLGDNVAFLVERSELYMFSILGILSAGAVYIPLDDNLPNERIEFILDDTQSRVVIVSDDSYERVKELTDDVNLLNISDIVNDKVGSLSYLPVIYDDLACILYTSGTTGVPKGVKVTRKSLLNVSAFYTDRYDLTDNDVYALFSAIGFDVSNFIICVVLYAGSCLSVIPEDIRFNMVEMNNYFIEHGVNHAFITTQVGKLFMQSIEDTSLDVLLVAGEKLGKVESPQNYELIDGFGPTESFAFMSSIPNSDKITESSVGYLNYNTKAY